MLDQTTDSEFDTNPEIIDHHIAQKIKERRLVLGLTQEQFAKLIGVTPQQAHKYEHSKNRISAGRLHYVAEALRVPVTFFYEDIPGAIPLPEMPPRQRICLEAARNFARIENRHHQEALGHLAKALADPSITTPTEISLAKILDHPARTVR